VFDCRCCSTFSSLASSSLSASVSAVSPSASSFVVGFCVVLASSRNLLPAVEAQGAALLMSATVSRALTGQQKLSRRPARISTGSRVSLVRARVADWWPLRTRDGRQLRQGD
jgi:hypothetical protein